MKFARSWLSCALIMRCRASKVVPKQGASTRSLAGALSGTPLLMWPHSSKAMMNRSCPRCWKAAASLSARERQKRSYNDLCHPGVLSRATWLESGPGRRVSRCFQLSCSNFSAHFRTSAKEDSRCSDDDPINHSFMHLEVSVKTDPVDAAADVDGAESDISTSRSTE